MPIFRLFALIIFCLIGTSPDIVWAQSEADKILSKLDQSYYYPQHDNGLEKVTARVQWEQLDVASGSGKFLRNPEFEFTWENDGANGKRDFELIADERGYSIKRKFELKNQIKNYGELIIPLMLKQKFAHYRGVTKKMAGGWVRLLYRTDSMEKQVESYNLLVNMNDVKVDKIRLKQRSAPRKVNGVFRYEKVGGKWAITESRSNFTMGELEYKETSNYRYKKFGDIWLVHQIDQVLKQDNRIFQSHRFKILDVRTTFSGN
jgi:hypothetical protein